MLLELPCGATATAPAWGCACTIACSGHQPLLIVAGLWWLSLLATAIFPMPPPEMAAPIPRHLVYIQKRIPWHYCDAVAINCLHCEWMAEQCHCNCFPTLLLQLLQVNCCFMFVILGNKAWPGAALKTAAMMPPLHYDAVEETCLQPKGFPLQCHLQ